MNTERLLAHFERISEAPGAVGRLRRFVLELAVRGKLVEQEPRDEPVSVLLERIRAERQRLQDRGAIPKARRVTTSEREEIPFSVPSSWHWVQLHEITSYIQRGKSPSYATGDGLPVISQRCVQWYGLDLTQAKQIARESLKRYETFRFLIDGDLLWNSTGTGTIGRIIRVKQPDLKLVCDSHVTVVRPLMVDPEFVRTWLRSDHVYGQIEQRAAGATNQVELTSQMATCQIVPLPPLAEQRRIVAKVDQLMALCDQLEAQLSARQAAIRRLLEALLHEALEPVT